MNDFVNILFTSTVHTRQYLITWQGLMQNVVSGWGGQIEFPKFRGPALYNVLTSKFREGEELL